MPDASMFWDVFIESCREHLTNMERNILDMEEYGVTMNNIDDIFRSVHTIKGDARSFDRRDIINLAHGMEDVLSAVREGRMSVTADLIDRMLADVDELRASLVQAG